MALLEQLQAYASLQHEMGF